MAMALVHGIDGLDRAHGRLFVVVGVFDGLHRGHAYLLDQLVRAAEARGAQPAVITFDHHPDEILTGHAPPLLCDPDERLERLEAAGVAVTVVQTFDIALRETPFDMFVRRIAGRVDLAGFLMTPDSAFGYERGGTPETVSALGRELGYEVELVPQFTPDGESVSSSRIRAAIAGGDFATAERLLGRPYAVVGTLRAVPGAGAGASPGAGEGEGLALAFDMPVALPPDGSYAADLVTDGAGSRQASALIAGGVPRIEGAGHGPARRAVLTFRVG